MKTCFFLILYTLMIILYHSDNIIPPQSTIKTLKFVIQSNARRATTEDSMVLNNRTPGSKDPSALSFTIFYKSIIQNVSNLRYLFAWFLETLNAPSGKRGPSRASLVVMATVCYWLPTAIVTSKDLYSDTYSPRLCPR